MQHVDQNSYMLRDEYVDLRNHQDAQLNDELHSIRTSIDEVGQELTEFKAEVREFKAEVRGQFKKVDTRFTKVDTQFAELRVEFLRLNAYVRNAALRVPTMRIQPLPAHDPDRGIILPQYFPKHWKEFCSLRDPSTPVTRRMLAYLARFYEIPFNKDSGSESESSTDDEVVFGDPDRVVESLEHILGLNERKFAKFEREARELANQRPKAIKRSQPDPGPVLGPNNRQKLEHRPATTTRGGHGDGDRPTAAGAAHSGHDSRPSASSDGLDKAAVVWEDRSTPRSQRTLQRKLKAMSNKLEAEAEIGFEPADSGSPTNINTPREPSE